MNGCVNKDYTDPSAGHEALATDTLTVSQMDILSTW